MNIFGIGLPELAVILVLALLVFGPKKLPEIGRNLARALGSFQKASQEFEAELKRGAAELEKSAKVDPIPQAETPAIRAANPNQPNPPSLYDPSTAPSSSSPAPESLPVATSSPTPASPDAGSPELPTPAVPRPGDVDSSDVDSSTVDLGATAPAAIDRAAADVEVPQTGTAEGVTPDPANSGT